MLVLIAAVIFALGVGFFAIQNTSALTIHLGSYFIPGVPIYVVMLASVLAGLLIGWIFNLIGAVGSSFAIRKRETELQRSQTNISDLHIQIERLKEENAQLHANLENDINSITTEPIETTDKPKWTENMKENWNNLLHPKTTTHL